MHNFSWAVVTFVSISFAGGCGADPEVAELGSPLEEPVEEQAEEPCGCPGAPDGAGEHPDESAGPPLTREDRAAVEATDAPAWGDASAPVTIVMFADYSCRFAAQAAGVLTQLKQEYGSTLRIVYRQRPLHFHPHAMDAARAAVAAEQLGLFLEYQQHLYDHQDQQNLDALLLHADEMGADHHAFGAALHCSRTQKRIDDDMKLAARLGVHASPTMFVNGRPVVGAWPLDKLRSLVDDALRAEGT